MRGAALSCSPGIPGLLAVRGAGLRKGMVGPDLRAGRKAGPLGRRAVRLDLRAGESWTGR